MGTLTPKFQKFRSEIHEVNVSGTGLLCRLQKEGRSDSSSVKKESPKCFRGRLRRPMELLSLE